MKLPLIEGGNLILDFDIENRPSSYWYDGQATAEVTAIAACFVGRPRSMRVFLLPPTMTNAEHRDAMVAMLEGFRKMYDQADTVTGHYIRRHDLVIINAALIEMGLPLLEQKMTIDTKLDLVKFSDIPKTQENLSDLMGLAEAKLHMKQSMWREANRLTLEGMAKTTKRVRNDVRQHMKLRLALTSAGLLKSPKVWRP